MSFNQTFIEKVAKEIVKESLDVNKSKYVHYLTDAIKTINILQKKEKPSYPEVVTLFNMTEMYLDKALEYSKNFPFA